VYVYVHVYAYAFEDVYVGLEDVYVCVRVRMFPYTTPRFSTLACPKHVHTSPPYVVNIYRTCVHAGECLRDASGRACEHCSGLMSMDVNSPCRV